MLDVRRKLDGTVAERFQNILRHFSDIRSFKFSVNTLPPDFRLVVLHVTFTEPYVSFGSGQGLAESIQGEINYFTITTKDSSGKTTYSEIDNVTVETGNQRYSCFCENT